MTAQRFRTRVSEVTALMYTGSNNREVAEFLGLTERGAPRWIPGPSVGLMWSDAARTWLDVPPGWYIVKDLVRDFWVTPAEALNDAYEPL